MLKKVLFLALCFLLIASSSVFGAMKSKCNCGPNAPWWGCYCLSWASGGGCAKISPANEDIISQYLLTPEPKVFYPVSDDTVGYTYQDFQHNNSMQRQIANDFTGIIHFTWMDLVAPDTTQNRYVDYNAHYPGDGWLTPGYGYEITPAEGRGGYSGLDIFGDSREVIAYHMINNKWYTAISIEKNEGGIGEFRRFDIPDSVDGKSQRLIWPFVACAKNNTGDTAFIHITFFSDKDNNKNTYAGYVRCFEKPSNRDTLICQSPGMPTVTIPRDTKLVPNKRPYLFPDGMPLFYNAPVVTSPATGSHKVAIVWCANIGGAFYKGEIYYAESSNNGSDWIAGGSIPTNRITHYLTNGWKDYWTFYTELAAVYDYNDVLHIFWTTCPANNPGESVTLWHWSPGYTAPRKITSRVVTADCGTWNLGIAKFNAGVEYMSGPAYNYLYLLYTGFQDGDTSTGGYANGDLFVKASSNGGMTWGGPDTSITNTHTPNCTPGNCKSENWASLAERVNDTLNIQYIYDLDAGGIPLGEGTFTLNPVRWLKYPRFLVPAKAEKHYTPSQMSSPVRWVKNNSSTTDTMTFDNLGTATLQVQLSGPSWLTATPNNFSIIEAGPTQKVVIGLNGGPYADTFLTGQIKILSNHGVEGGGPNFNDTEYVDVNFVVTDTFYFAEFDTCKRGPRLVVSNVGNLGAQSDSAGMFYKGLNYLFDGSPIMVTNQIPGYGNKGFSWIHSKADFLPEGHLIKTDYPNLKTTVWIDRFALLNWRRAITDPTHWAWFGWTKWSKIIQFDWVPGKIHGVLIKNWWTPSLPPKWWMDVTSTAPVGGYFGIAGDWDVTADYSGKDKGGIIDSLNLVYLRQDTINADKYYGGYQFLRAYVKKGSITTNYYTPFAMHVGNNETQMYPFGGYDDDSLLKYMWMPGDFIEQDSAQDMNIIISAVEMLNPDTTTEIGIDYTAIVSDSGLTDFVRQAAMFKKVKPGDANVDGKVTVSDVVYLVNYLFKGGPEPWLLFSDANGDAKVTVSDVVYLVNYLFKGGPSPKFIVGVKPF